tara:strand:- start:1043 stop:1627 length:585 start_codon:yes stop_codon:yes gene_type:complete
MEKTADFILEKVAPIFNRQGYVGTTLRDLTEATKLTKGAIYGNFENKEELALKAFLLNFKKAFEPLEKAIASKDHSIAKLYALTDYYRNYYDYASGRGGCPVLNVTIDAQHINSKLFDLAKQKSERLVLGIEMIIRNGIKNGEIKKSVDAEVFGQNIYSMIEGSLFLAFTFKRDNYVLNILDHIDHIIEHELKA